MTHFFIISVPLNFPALNYFFPNHLTLGKASFILFCVKGFHLLHEYHNSQEAECILLQQTANRLRNSDPPGQMSSNYSLSLFTILLIILQMETPIPVLCKLGGWILKIIRTQLCQYCFSFSYIKNLPGQEIVQLVEYLPCVQLTRVQTSVPCMVLWALSRVITEFPECRARRTTWAQPGVVQMKERKENFRSQEIEGWDERSMGVFVCV